MLKKIEKKVTAREDMKAFVAEAKGMIKKYGWEEKTVMPYGYAVKVTKLVADFEDYDRCTEMSKEYLIEMANGLAPIMNKWEENELAPKINVILHNGHVAELPSEFAEELIAEGLCVMA